MPARGGGARFPGDMVRIERAPAEDDLLLAVLRGVGLLVRLLLDLLFRHRLISVGLLVGLVAGRLAGWLAVLLSVVGVGLIAVALRLSRPAWWSRYVSGPAWRYRRRHWLSRSW